MKPLLFILLLLTLFKLPAQIAQVELQLDLDKACAFDSIAIQSIFANTFTRLDAQIKTHQLNLFTPVDRVIFMVEGDAHTAMAYNVPVEEKVWLSVKQEAGCNNLIIKGVADKRVAEFNHYEALPKEEKQSELLALIRKNVDAVTVGDYLQSYLNSDFVNPKLSADILAVVEAHPGPALEHHINQIYLNNLKQSLAEAPLQFSLSDSLLIPHQSASLNKWDKPYEYRLIDFWYTSCAPCLKQHKIFKEKIAQGKFPEEVELIGIAIEPQADRWHTFMANNQLPWKNFLEKPGANLQQKYGVIRYPTYLLVDKGNQIIARLYSYRGFEIKMKELLGD